MELIDRYRPIQLAKQVDKILKLVMGIQAAGVGQDPQYGMVDFPRLAAKPGFWALEGHPVSANPQDSEAHGAKQVDLLFQSMGSSN